jgi:hypothetical protein
MGTVLFRQEKYIAAVQSSLAIWTAQANGQSTMIRCPQSAVRIFSVASWNLYTQV